MTQGQSELPARLKASAVSVASKSKIAGSTGSALSREDVTRTAAVEAFDEPRIHTISNMAMDDARRANPGHPGARLAVPPPN